MPQQQAQCLVRRYCGLPARSGGCHALSLMSSNFQYLQVSTHSHGVQDWATLTGRSLWRYVYSLLINTHSKLHSQARKGYTERRLSISAVVSCCLLPLLLPRRTNSHFGGAHTAVSRVMPWSASETPHSHRVTAPEQVQYTTRLPAHWHLDDLPSKRPRCSRKRSSPLGGSC